MSLHHESSRKCHRFLIGLERAEGQVKRERSLGWETGCIDPGIAPGDYHYCVEGDDVLCHAVDQISTEYAEILGLCLKEQGARIVGVFDRGGNCLFRRFPEAKSSPEETQMKNKIKLNKILYRSGQSYKGKPCIESVTPFAWICGDLYHTCRLEDDRSYAASMTARQISSFGCKEKAETKFKRDCVVSALIDKFGNADPATLADLLFDRPDVLEKLRPILSEAEVGTRDIGFDDDLPF